MTKMVLQMATAHVSVLGTCLFVPIRASYNASQVPFQVAIDCETELKFCLIENKSPNLLVNQAR